MKRALLVGAGGMGRAWARNISTSGRAELVRWVDIRPGAAKAASEELQLANVQAHHSLTEALRIGDFDFVVDVTIPEAHCEVTCESLAAGFPVLGEKPMASSLAEARKMIGASEASDKLYMVSQSRRYDGRLTAFRRAIAEVGALGILNADFYIGAHFGGFRDEMDHVLLLDMSIHSFDQARALTNKKPISVFADEFNPSWSWYQHGASANCLFEMEDGVRFSYRGSWCAEGLMTSWECDWRAVGENGSAIWDGHDRIQTATVVSKGGFHSETSMHDHSRDSIRTGIDGSLHEFLDALETGATPQGECHDNYWSLAMVFAAIESAKQGRRVRIDEL
jgi:predicted dehydrogenase